jgi:hypothetical protein
VSFGVRNVRALDGIEENIAFPLPRGSGLPPDNQPTF